MLAPFEGYFRYCGVLSAVQSMANLDVLVAGCWLLVVVDHQRDPAVDLPIKIQCFNYPLNHIQW
jgi:hypothetical protein